MKSQWMRVMSSAALGLGACGGSEAGGPMTGAGIDSLDGGTGGGPETGSVDATGAPDEGESGSATGSEDGDAPKLDLATGEEPTDDGCKAVDFLFVIDNSVSMQHEQEALVGAFPGFMATIEEALGGEENYHILVTDTDAWGRCSTANGWTGSDPMSETCNDYIEQTVFEGCDQTLGAGVVHPAGQHASNRRCELAGGRRYITAEEPDLVEAFSCIARVGIAGAGEERPMDAMMQTVSPDMNAPGGCNNGFVRDEALLVVTFVSDDPFYDDSLGPQQWYDTIVAAKGGDPEAIVVLGMTPNWPGCQEDKGPPKGAHWTEFVELFGERGLHGNVCGTSAEYVSFFQAAVEPIAQACEDFSPPG